MKSSYWSLLVPLFLLMSCHDRIIKKELQQFHQKEVNELMNIELIKKLYQDLDNQNFIYLKEFFSLEFMAYSGSMNEPKKLDDVITYLEMFYSAFPDYSHRIEKIIACNHYVVVYQSLQGTHNNIFGELLPTNNEINYKGIVIYKILNQKIDLMWNIEDELTMMKQLGLELTMKP